MRRAPKVGDILQGSKPHTKNLILVLSVEPSPLRRRNGKQQYYKMVIYRLRDHACHELIVHDEELRAVRVFAKIP